MAKGIPFPEANDILRAPEGAAPGTVYDLHIHRYRDMAGNPHVISKWQFRPEELALVVAAGGAFWFHAWGLTHPPVAVEGENPFVRAAVAGEGEDLAAEQNKRRLALIERIGTVADLACSTPLEGELGDVAYDLLRQAAAQLSSDQQRLVSVPTPDTAAEPASDPCKLAEEYAARVTFSGEIVSAYVPREVSERIIAWLRKPSEAGEHPNEQDYRNRAERAEAECAELRALLAVIDRDARPENWADEPGSHADAWRALDAALGKVKA